MCVNEHAIQVVARDGQPNAFLGADGDEHRFKALGEQIVQIFDPRIEAKIDAEIEDVLDLAVDHFGRKPVRGNAEAEHAARLRAAPRTRLRRSRGAPSLVRR